MNFVRYFAFILIVIIGSSRGIFVDKQFKVRASLREFATFGFEQGGTISSNISYPQEDAQNAGFLVYVCSSGEYTKLVNEGDIGGSGNICEEFEACELVSPSLSLTHSVKRTDLYHLLVINCRGFEIQAEFTYLLLNPGGNQLSLGNQPLPSLYLILSTLWTLLFVSWIVLWFWWRQVRTRLHTILVLVSFLKFAVTIISLSYWKIYESGNSMDQLKYLQSFLFAVSETAFFCSLLLIAKGWQITRIRLPSSEIRTVALSLVVLLSTLLFFSFYNDGYYFLSLMIMYFFMLPRIFTSITRNTRALETQLLLMNRANVNFDRTPLQLKLRLFKVLRTSVVLYLISILVVNAMRIVMVWYLEWLNYLFNEAVILVMICLISYLLLPHNEAIFTIVDPMSVFNPDELFGGEGEVTLHINEQPPDMSNIIVVEYPWNSKQQDAIIPLALGVAEKHL